MSTKMALSNQGKKLLGDIFSASLKSQSGLNAARFRADNEKSIPELNHLEQIGYLQRKDNLYSINLLAFVYLVKENPDAISISKNCGLIFDLLQGHYRENLEKKMTVPDIARNTGLSENDVKTALGIIIQTPILSGYVSDFTRWDAYVAPSENILKYKSFEDILQEQEEWDKHRLIHTQSRDSKKSTYSVPNYQAEQGILLTLPPSRTNWKAIQQDYDITKTGFGKRINFIKDNFKRKIIFRDVEQAYNLASWGFSKPAVILAGGVIEELLRLYLKHKQVKPIKNDFDGYIQTCEQQGLLKVGISRLSDSARHFRNLVHLEKEKDKKDTISKVAAKGAVASIFTIASDL
ncbi:MAG: hypothetical protein L6N96_02995 [Candidatus Methylarchaceae archaeon HK02M2]|nr:hypothetical protein [Candidatus Methylarchaceae archaeon HK02M2]